MGVLGKTRGEDHRDRLRMINRPKINSTKEGDSRGESIGPHQSRRTRYISTRDLKPPPRET